MAKILNVDCARRFAELASLEAATEPVEIQIALPDDRASTVDCNTPTGRPASPVYRTFVRGDEFKADLCKRMSTKAVVAQSLAVATLLAVGAPTFAQNLYQTKNLASGESYSNPAGGTLMGNSGGPGVSAIGVTAGAVTNSGTIASDVTSGKYDLLFGIYVTGKLAGGITNSGLAGSIVGQNIGIGAVAGGTISDILNEGTITGTTVSGVSARGGRLGSVNNIGTASLISGGTLGVAILNGSTAVGIVNAGAMVGGQIGVYVNGGASSLGHVNNTSVGSAIFGGISGISIGSGSVGPVTNQGTITGSSSGIFVTTGGSVTSVANVGTASVISGTSLTPLLHELGISVIGTGTVGSVINQGTIMGVYDGVFARFAGPKIGSVSNSGLILGGNMGIELRDGSQLGPIVNSGIISGSNNGIGNYGSSISSITNGGTVSTGNNAAISVWNGGTVGIIENGGLLSGIRFGLQLGSGATVAALQNTGSIVGARSSGIQLQQDSIISGGLTNASGLIQGNSQGFAASTGSVIGGGVINSGVITASNKNYGSGISLSRSTLSGGISNSAAAVINGASEGILVGSTSTVAGGITNAGTISSGKTGVAIVVAGHVVSGGLYNSGTISGGMYAVYVDATSSLGGIIIAGDGAKFAGDVYAPSTAVRQISGSTFIGTNAFNVASFDVASGATLDMGVMTSTAGGAKGITVTTGLINEGRLSVGRNTAIINGSYSQVTGGEFGVGVASKTDHGVLATSGAANLASNASIVVDVAAGNSLTNQETIAGVLTSSNLTASTFKVTDNSDLFSFIGLIDGNNVDLVAKLNPVVVSDVVANNNTKSLGAATVIDQIIKTSGGTGLLSGVINDIANSPTSHQVSNDVSQTLPLLLGDVNLATYAAMSQINQVVQSRVEGNYGMSAGAPYLSEESAWVKPIGSWASASDRNGAPGFTSGVEGLVLGGDAALSNTARFGLAFAYANIDASGNAHEAPNNDRVNMYQFMGYGSYALDSRTEVNTQIDGGINSNEGHRNIEFERTAATSSFNSSDAHIGIGLARALPLSNTTIFTPQVRVDYTWIRSDGYTEGGAGPLDLHVQSTSFESLLTQLNGKLTQQLSDYVTVFGNIGFGYDSMARDSSAVVAAFAGAPGLNFTTSGVGLRPRMLLGGLGVVSTQHGDMPEVSLRYDLQQREGFADRSVSFKARWAF